MSSIVTFLPSQTISQKEKLSKSAYSHSDDILGRNNSPSSENEKSWGELCVDYHVQLALSQETKRNEMYTLYRVKDGALNDSDYSHVLNPLNVEDPNYKRFPAKLRSYNIIKPVINEFLGERSEKPLNPMVTIGNNDANNLYKDKLALGVQNILKQQFINELNSLGFNTGVQSQGVPSVEEYVKKYSSTYDNERAVDAQNIIDYATLDLELDEKLQEGFEHWCTVGKIIGEVNVLSEDLEAEIIHPLDFYHPMYGDNSPIEDGPWAVRKWRYVSRTMILDRIQTLSKEDLDWIELQLRSSGKPFATAVIAAQQGFDMNNFTTKEHTPYEMTGRDNDNILLWRVTWKSYRKIGILSTVDELGQPYEIEVDETYKLNKEKGDIEIEWKYITEVWEGYRLDGLNANEFKYFGIRPLPIQRSELNSKQKAKLPYIGRYEIDIDGRIISIVKTGYPYQVLFNTFHFQFEKIMNKNKEKINIIPMGLIPKKEGWTEDKFFYFMEAMNTMIIDETRPNAPAALQALKAIDLSLSQYAAKMVDFLTAIKNEFWDAVGMNRQRYGQTQASDGKATNEQAVFHASLITAELNRKYDKFIERLYQALIDWSKIAWINGKKVNFVRNDGSRVLLNINPEDHIGTDYNIFVKRSNEEYSKLKTLENLSLTLAQNGASGSMITKALNANSIPKIAKIFEEGEEIQKQYEMQKEEMLKQYELKKEEMKNDTVKRTQETSMYTADKQYDSVIDRENIITERELELAKIELNKGEEGSGDKTIEQARLNLDYRKQLHTEQKDSKEIKFKYDKLEVDKMKARQKPTSKK